MGNISRKSETLKKSQKEILELLITVTEVKNAFQRHDQLQDQGV